jgi:SAM-dependent methyltransferase
MYRSVYDLRGFYNSKTGRVVRRILQQRIHDFWPDAKGLRFLGCGYATPYLRGFADGAERVFALMPAGHGAHAWPYNTGTATEEKNLVCLAEEAELPFETNSIDRILLIHDLEFSELLKANLQEIWRVLKSNGRLLVVVPNRSGFWARADWSPFGQGTPYSATQIHNYLRDNQFVHERTEEALFMPPLRFPMVLKAARFFEKIGKNYISVAPGVHIVEASKQMYARADQGSGSRVTVRGRGFVPSAAPQGS